MWHRRCLRGLGALVLSVLAGALGVSLVPLPAALDRATPSTLTLLDRQGALLTQLSSSTARVQTPVSLAQMGPWLPRVTVALEDRRFYQHHGIDWRGTAASAWRNLRFGRIVGGGSTISQQVIKLASARQGRAWSAKLYEAVAAWNLERRWSKERILAEYLNRSAYGNRLVGPEAAARWYFGKPAVDLTLAEAVFLAGLPRVADALQSAAPPCARGGAVWPLAAHAGGAGPRRAGRAGSESGPLSAPEARAPFRRLAARRRAKPYRGGAHHARSTAPTAHRSTRAVAPSPPASAGCHLRRRRCAGQCLRRHPRNGRLTGFRGLRSERGDCSA